MLKQNDWIDEGTELAPGETKRICHTNCEAGEDTRFRLYITRPQADEAKLIAYCHNCQESGFAFDNGYTAYRDDKHDDRFTPDDSTALEEVEPPPNMISNMDDWPALAKAWAYKNYLSKDVADRFNIQYDPSSNRVYLPRYEGWAPRVHTGKLLGYQLRALDKHSGPKYITAALPDVPSWTFIHPSQATCNYVVVVEDLLSGIKILEATYNEGEGANFPGVYVNHSTRVDPTMCYTIARRYKYAIVWFDNDSDHVIEQAHTMQRTISLYNDKCRAVVMPPPISDAKHYAESEVLYYLDQVWDNG